MMEALAALKPTLDHAAAWLRDFPPDTTFHVHSDLDADGITSRFLMTDLLEQLGFPYTASSSREKDWPAYRALFDRTEDVLVILDKGSSHLEPIAQAADLRGIEVLIIDHHNVVGRGDEVLLISPRMVGLDGSRDACSSTTTWAFYHHLLPERSASMVWAALAGAIGDWQHTGGWRGIHPFMLECAEQAGELHHTWMPGLVGMDLQEALARKLGSYEAVSTDDLLRSWGVPVVSDVELLTEEQRDRLLEGLTLTLLAQGLIDQLSALVWYHHVDDHGISLRMWYRILDACIREGDVDAALKILHDRDWHDRVAQEHYARYREAIFQGVRRLRTRMKQVGAGAAILQVSDPNYTGMVGGLAREHHRLHPDVVNVTYARRQDGRIQISTRGTHQQVARGLDLGAILRDVGREIDAEGGGHPIAAGIVVQEAVLQRALRAIEDGIRQQLGLEPKPDPVLQ